MKIIVLGKAGSGKGTQAKLLAEKLNIPHISTGDMFRRAYADKTDLGIKAYEYWGKGNLVPDDVMNGMIKERLGQDDCKNGFILDGYPRKIEQAEFLETITGIDLVISVEVSDETVIRRMKGRRTCPKCGVAYNIYTEPKPKKDNVCDNCGVELEVRTDETEEGMKKRLDIYKDEIQPITEFYKQKDLLKTVDGEKGIEGIWKQIKSIVAL
ncbi:adenylate kinase [Candidatus Woesearchaeota archaeon]|nr:adenylate kinase [Candidatus Woesearchaeota archaeon]MBW3021860.1 adenylate kinase [Candidatus Woesearchaeota archaeon]